MIPCRCGGLEIDAQLELDTRLQREVRGLLAFEDGIDVPGRAPILVDRINPVGDQAAVSYEEVVGIDSGQAVPTLLARADEVIE